MAYNPFNWKWRVINFLLTLIWVFIAVFIAYYVYGFNWTAAGGFILWAIVVWVASALVMIPYGGVAFLWVIGALWNPILMETFTITPSWLTDTTFVILMIIPTIIYGLFTFGLTGLIILTVKDGFSFEQFEPKFPPVPLTEMIQQKVTTEERLDKAYPQKDEKKDWLGRTA